MATARMFGARSLLAATLLLAAGTACGSPAAEDPSAPPAPERPEVAAARAFAEWDAARAEAWAADDPHALAALYRGAAARGDLEALARWHARGLRVTGLRTQVLALEVLDSNAGRYRLRLRARIADTARVVGLSVDGGGGGDDEGGGDAGTPLPHDTARTRVVVLARVDGAWRVERISEPPDPSR
ncbi:hypothetical protein [Nocardioides fonticola]